MGGKLVGFLVMVLAAVLAWKWLRAQQAGRGRPANPPRRDEDATSPEDVITLERDPKTGVYRPADENHRNRNGS